MPNPLIDKMVEAGRSIIGASYVFWGGGELEACSPEYMNCPGADAAYVLANGPNCLVGNTSVVGSEIEGASKRFYNGDLITIKTASGNKLSGTPNHPVLTSRGWVPLKMLKKGNYVISHPDSRQLPLSKPDVYEEPTPFHKLFSSIGETGLVERHIQGSLDFHGDGVEGKVDIVNPFSKLRNGTNTPVVEQVPQLHLTDSNQTLGTLIADGKPYPTFNGLLGAPQSLVGSKGLHPKLIFSVINIPNSRSFPGSPQGYPVFLQPLEDNTTRNSKITSYLPDATTIKITPSDFANVYLDSRFIRSSPKDGGFRPTPKLDTSFYETTVNGMIADTEPLTDRVGGLPLDVRIDKIIDVNISHFAGNVYNLQTKSGYYISNNIITHNCSGMLNWMRTQAGLPVVGGTPDYGSFMSPWEDFVPDKQYPVGTILLEPFVSGVSEGHVAMVSTEDQHILQSNTYWGATETPTVMDQHAYTPWSWAGFMPDALPDEAGGGGGGDKYTYPGNCATPADTAAWMANVAQDKYGLPAILPVMTSCVEMTGAWSAPGCVDNVSGYSSPVDGCSVGYFQQQADDLGCGTFGWGTQAQLVDANYALKRFCEEAAKLIGTYGEDVTSLGEWCQAVQRSAYPDRYAEDGYPMAKSLLSGWTPVNPPKPKEDTIVNKYNFACASDDENSRAFTYIAAAALDAFNIETLIFSDGNTINSAAENILSTNDLSKANLMVVGKGAHDLLPADAQVKDGWSSDSPIWQGWEDPASNKDPVLLTLNRVKNWLLWWIARAEVLKEADLDYTFESLLKARDSKYVDLLKELDGNNPPAPPNPPNLSIEQRVTKLEQEVGYIETEITKGAS